MTVLTLSQVIPRPVADVFQTVVDGGRFAEWNPTIRSARQLTDGPIGDGTRFEWDLKGFGRVVQELAEFEPNRRVRIVPTSRLSKGATGSRSRPWPRAPGSTTNWRWCRWACTASSAR